MKSKFRWFDFAWLKQWYVGNEHRKPNPGTPKNPSSFILLSGSVTIGITKAATKSEARSNFKKERDIVGRLPRGLKVVKT